MHNRKQFLYNGKEHRGIIDFVLCLLAYGLVYVVAETV